MAEEKFKLPISSYDELCKIVMGYGHYDGPVSPDQVKSVVGIHRVTISRNNAFLLAVGIIEGERNKEKQATTVGRQLANALMHSQPEYIQQHWRDIAIQNEFMQKVVSAVRIRSGMDLANLGAHIAYSAGAPKSAITKTGANTVRDILVVAGLIREEDGKLIAAAESSRPLDIRPSIEVVPNVAIRDTKNEESVEYVHQPTMANQQDTTPFQVHIQVQIQCSVQDLPQLGSKIRALVQEISQSTSITPQHAD